MATQRERPRRFVYDDLAASSPGTISGPREVPAEFWTAASLRAGFEARHIGRVIRAYRVHPWHGRRPVTQELVAEWLGTTQPRLSRVENGPRIEQLDLLVHWATILGMPQQQLWFALPGRPFDVTAHRAEADGAARNAVEHLRDTVAQEAPAHGGSTDHVLDLGILAAEVGSVWADYQDGRYMRAVRLIPGQLSRSQSAVRDHRGQEQLRAKALLAMTYHCAATTLTKINERYAGQYAAERGLVAAAESEVRP